MRKRVAFICGPSKEYYYGDKRPPYGAGYFDFIEWQEAQLRKRRRPKKKAWAKEKG
jgi:hypothetical protein